MRGGLEHSLACQGKTLHPHPVVCISCKDGLAACVIDFSLSFGSCIMLYLWILTHRWKTFCEMLHREAIFTTHVNTYQFQEALVSSPLKLVLEV